MSSITQSKSFDFAIRIYHLSKYLNTDKREYVISKQVLRSGTSIAANIEEAIGGYSQKDFAAKYSIAYKEARETLFWLRLLNQVKLLDTDLANSLISDCEELIKIIGKTISTMKKKLTEV